MTTRIGMIGCSGHAGYVLAGIQELPDARLVAVAPGCAEEDMSGFLATPAAQQAGPAAYGDYREMLEREHPDVVAVNPFFYLHSAVTAECLRRGIPVICEKPLALELAALEELRKVQASAGVPMSMMLSYRYEPAFWTARRLVSAGAIGEPVAGYAQKSYKLGTRPAFYQRRKTFGGIIPWIGIHAIDWFQWVSGRTYRAVWARHRMGTIPGYPELEDHAGCLFELDNGGTAAMTFDYLRPAGAPTHGDDRLRLIGTAGALEVRWPDFIDVVASTGPVEVALERPALGIVADFVRSVTDRSHPCTISTAEAFDVTETALRARDAADRGERGGLGG